MRAFQGVKETENVQCNVFSKKCQIHVYITTGFYCGNKIVENN